MGSRAVTAAETIFVGDDVSSEHAVEHWNAGALPVPPFGVQLAPVLLSFSEPAANVAPPLTYPGPASVLQVAFGQYGANTALIWLGCRIQTLDEGDRRILRLHPFCNQTKPAEPAHIPELGYVTITYSA